MSKIIIKEKSLADYLDMLVARGQHYFTTDELHEALKIHENTLTVSLSRLAKKGRIKMIRVGFGIILERYSGELHPSFYLEKMMKHLDSKYYLGLLSAAAFWGASHQASMTYQVMVEKVVKPIKFEKGRVEFITKKLSFSDVGLQKVPGVGGYFVVSSPELTAIDLLRFPKRSGHLNNIATVLEDLIEKWDKKRLVTICHDTNVPTVTLQRLGFLLDVILDKQKEARLVEKILESRTTAPSVLSVSKKNEKNKSYPFNIRWKIHVNTEVEPD